jgi:hypothetical protein
MLGTTDYNIKITLIKNQKGFTKKSIYYTKSAWHIIYICITNSSAKYRLIPAEYNINFTHGNSMKQGLRLFLARMPFPQ